MARSGCTHDTLEPNGDDKTKARYPWQCVFCNALLPRRRPRKKPAPHLTKAEWQAVKDALALCITANVTLADRHRVEWAHVKIAAYLRNPKRLAKEIV